MHPRESPLVAQTDGYYSYPAQTFTSSLPTPGSPSHFLLSREGQWDQQGPDLPSFQIRGPQVGLGVLSAGPPCALLTGPSFSTRGPGHHRRLPEALAFPGSIPSPPPIQTLMSSGPAYMLFDPPMRTGFSAHLHVGEITST